MTKREFSISNCKDCSDYVNSYTDTGYGCMDVPAKCSITKKYFTKLTPDGERIDFSGSIPKWCPKLSKNFKEE